MSKKTLFLSGMIVILFLTMNVPGTIAHQTYSQPGEQTDTTIANPTNLSIQLIKPKPGYLYIADKPITRLPLGATRIFGKITIELAVRDNSSELQRIELYIDDDFKFQFSSPYYKWMLDEPLTSEHTLKIVAYDIFGGQMNWIIRFHIICFGRLPKAPPSPEVGIPSQANTDGYNYYRNKNGVGDFVYNQLWYFNFLDDQGTSDPTDDIAGVAAYGLANPENRLSGGGLTNAFGMIIRDPSQGASFPLFSQNYNPANFSASETFEPASGPELQNPSGTIDVVTPDHYHITGQVINNDKEIRWDLHYQRSFGNPWLPWMKWTVPNTLGIIPAWITYHMQMANAIVNGTFYVRDGVNETTYELESIKGYHDGFYSEFVFSIFEWDWIDFKQENLSVHLLHPHAPVYSCQDGWETCTPGNLRVVTNITGEEKEYNFYRRCDQALDEITVYYENLATDPRYPDVNYPTQATIIAEDNEGNILHLDWLLRRYMIVYFDVPDPFFDTVTFEIIADFSGTFHEATTNTTIPIAGPGWSDWSGQAFPQQ